MRKNKKTGRTFVAGVLLCGVMIIILAVYAQMLQRELNAEVVGILQEVSAQSVVILNKEISSQFAILREVSDRLCVEDDFSPEEAVAELKNIVKRYSFRRMGVIMPDGTAYTTDNTGMNLKDREFFKASMQGKRFLSDKLVDRVSGDEIIVYSMPVYEQNRVCAVLFATYKIDIIQQLLSTTFFGGKGYSYVINSAGECVINTTSPTGFHDFTNVYLSLLNTSAGNAKAATALKQGIEAGDGGYITFWNQVNKYMFYAPLGVNDWRILTVVPTGVMDTTRNFIMFNTYILCIVLSAVFISLSYYIIKTERLKKKELSDILYVDDVTNGYSFARFNVETQMRMEKEERNTAYIMMDIDKFKVINELFGYDEGNKMLCYIWSVWKKCSKEGEIFARRIADRFVALWFFEDREELEFRLQDFVEELQRNVPNPDMDYNLKATMGVYLIKDKRESVQTMMNYAMMAHSSAKERGDISYAFYDDDFRENLLTEKLLEDQMRPALKRKEFIVFYQPKYSVMTKELVGAEALIRWKKADESIVLPGEFIPLAEKTGFINYLDRYIFAEVCKYQKIWADEGKKVVPVSVNLSRRHLYNEAFLEEYKKIMDKTGVNPKYVQLELTESAIFENQEELCKIIDKLHMMGFQILMDDFGTGYSSLMMLKSVPIDVLKLDKSFVDDFDDPRGEKIITSVIKLAQSLQIEVTAEGVETEEQYSFLKDLGCNSVQGFYFARPMPQEDYAELL